MNQRQAKRLACYVVADWIEGMLCNGDVQSREDECGEPLTEAECGQLEAALREVAEEMLARHARGPLFCDTRKEAPHA